jgi:hypothetical protein
VTALQQRRHVLALFLSRTFALWSTVSPARRCSGSSLKTWPSKTNYCCRSSLLSHAFSSHEPICFEQAVSQKAAVNDAPPAAPGPPNQKENPALNEQQLEQRLQHTQDELDACQSRLASTTSALNSAEGAISNLTASAAAAAAASAAQIDAQAKIISRLEADLDRLKAEAADADTCRVAALSSRQAALALAADHEDEIRRLHALLADVEECSIANKQIEASLSAHAAKDQLEEQEQAAQGSEGDANQKSGQLAECKAEFSGSHIPDGAHDASVLQQQLQQLQDTVDAMKDAASAESVLRESVQRENAALAHNITALSAEISQLQSSCKLQQEANAVHVAGLTSERDALAAEVKSLQAENQSLISNQKKAQRQNDSQEILVLKKELEKYEQGEAKMLLEVNRRLALAKRCSEISQSALTSLSKCSDVAFTQTPPVDEHASTVTPASVLSILGKYLDHIVVGLMDLKKASDSLAATVPALKTDCDRLMLKIVELEKLRVEWSENQSELVQTKSALAKQLQQQHVHNQTDASVLSILHSCGGGSAGEQLQQAALRVAEELKTSRMTVSELARQVEVERSSSNSRHRVADSQGSELRASLAAAEQRAAAEVSAVKAQLRSSELHCQQVSLDLQAATKLNAELSEQVSVFESVLAEKDAEVAEVSQQLKLARALVSSLSDQAEVAVNLELVMRA